MIRMDWCHIDFIAGCVRARKPRNILELGIGTGSVTKVLNMAKDWDAQITSVDNWHDWNGTPNTDWGPNVKVVTSSERDFVYSAPSDTYDFLVSDADHEHAHEWFSEHCRIVKPGGFMFFHDTNNSDYPGLMQLPRMAIGMPHYHFTESTTADERCERGLLFVINKK